MWFKYKYGELDYLVEWIFKFLKFCLFLCGFEFVVFVYICMYFKNVGVVLSNGVMFLGFFFC